MLGFSVYFEDDIDIEKEIKANKNFDLVFTSLHYPLTDKAYDQFLKLYEICCKYDIKVCVDINNKTLMKYPALADMDIILRLDFGFSYNQIARLSSKRNLALNASTLNMNCLYNLKAAKTRMGNIIAIHNFYPLEYSGLSYEYFNKQNELIKSFGLKLGAFISGNGKLRGPVYKGLPTLENDRYKNPYLNFIKFKRFYELDLILLAEDVVDKDKEYICKFAKNETISLPAYISDDYKNIKSIKVRPDISEYLIRNEREKKSILPQNPRFIKRGDLVILNNLSGRYSGEIEIIKKDLAISMQRNVIGRVDEQYLDLIDYIQGGDIIEFDRR